MAHLLHLTASPRGTKSYSRRVSSKLVDAWLEAYPYDIVTARDIGHQTIPYMTEELIDAFYTPASERTAAQTERLRFSDELVEELQSADVYIFSMPMYNFSVPAVFKAYIDLIVRIGVTVTSSWEGLLKNKKAFIVTSRGGGGYGAGEARESYNFEDPYLKTVLELIGITDQTFVHVPDTSSVEDALIALAAAEARVKAIVAA